MKVIHLNRHQRRTLTAQARHAGEPDPVATRCEADAVFDVSEPCHSKGAGVVYNPDSSRLAGLCEEHGKAFQRALAEAKVDAAADKRAASTRTAPWRWPLLAIYALYLFVTTSITNAVAKVRVLRERSFVRRGPAVGARQEDAPSVPASNRPRLSIHSGVR